MKNKYFSRILCVVNLAIFVINAAVHNCENNTSNSVRAFLSELFIHNIVIFHFLNLFNLSCTNRRPFTKYLFELIFNSVLPIHVFFHCFKIIPFLFCIGLRFAKKMPIRVIARALNVLEKEKSSYFLSINLEKKLKL